MSGRGARALKSINRRLGRRFGVSLVRHPVEGSLDRELSRLAEIYQISTVLDVGAHTGGFALRMRSLGFEGTILSFEPFGPTFDQLSEKASSDASWQPFKVALGEVAADQVLHLVGASGEMNSLREVSPHLDVYSTTQREQGTAVVRVERLDSLSGLPAVDWRSALLKIDTQGFEREVLRGAGSLLDSIPCVVLEASVQPLYQGAPVIEEMVEALRRAGFELTGAFPIHRYGNGARVIEFDCTFARFSD